MDITQKNKITYDALADEYDEKTTIRKDFNTKVIGRFVKFITTGKNVLDIGCAVGLELQILREKKFVPTGVELSSEMVKRARARNPEVDIIEGDFMEITLRRKFDAVFAQAFIHLFPKKRAMDVLQKIRNFLKRGGIVHITTSKSEESKEGWIEKTDYRGNYKRFRKLWTQNELRDALEQTKFEILDYYEIKDPFQKKWMVFLAKK